MSEISIDLSDLRKPYKDEHTVLLEDALPFYDPIKIFESWFNEIKKSNCVYEPNAVCLSTCTKDGYPSSRMVLLKYFGSDGFKIFTNLSSRKGEELKSNPRGALLFYWDKFNRQVRIEGNIEMLAEEEAEKYFQSRPKKSQVAAAVSEQSKIIGSRSELVEKYLKLEKAYSNEQCLPKPKDWGGIKLIPKSFEFWQGQNNRMHDRILFSLKLAQNYDAKQVKKLDNGWFMYRLQP